jgi:aldehyde:ferredoxin oxidoreductase
MWSKITVNMAKGTVEKSPIDEAYKELGGRSLVAQFVIQNVPPQCDPLGDQNTLIFCTTVFAGTVFSTAHRLSVGGKSPLTGGIKESNVGGNAATFIAEHGIKYITIHGVPADNTLKILHINTKGELSLIDADEYRNMGNYGFVDAMYERFGKKVAVISIGMAGERKYRASSIQVTEFGTGHPSRAAARGGLGAVMGSKGLKAVVIEKAESKYKVEYADEGGFKEAAKELNQHIFNEAQTNPFHLYGTIATVEGVGTNGVLPVENFSGKLFKNYQNVGVGPFMKNIAERGGANKRPCQPGCMVQCSNVYNDKDGKYITSGLEYETVALFGPNCRIDDLDQIARMDRLCDDIGLDTIDTGGAMGVAMEAGKIAWGDSNAVIALLEEVKKGTEFGTVIGNGCEAVGKYLGVTRIPTVKHQCMPGYEPRMSKGMGVTYATSAMGADHTTGFVMGRVPDDLARGGQAGVSSLMQAAMCFMDSMMCLFAFGSAANRIDLLMKCYFSLFGGAPDPTRITVGLGAKTLLTELAFNKAAGFTQEDSVLPEFFLKERAPATGAVFDINPYELEHMFDF